MKNLKTLNEHIQSLNEAKAYKLKASEFGQDTISQAAPVKNDAMGTWRVYSTYAIDQVSGNDNKDERDVVFFEVMPYKDQVLVKIGGIHNLGKTNGSTYGKPFTFLKYEWDKPENRKGLAQQASNFLTNADHLKWLNKNAKSEGQKIKWALKDDYSGVIEDLVNKAIGK